MKFNQTFPRNEGMKRNSLRTCDERFEIEKRRKARVPPIGARPSALEFIVYAVQRKQKRSRGRKKLPLFIFNQAKREQEGIMCVLSGNLAFNHLTSAKRFSACLSWRS